MSYTSNQTNSSTVSDDKASLMSSPGAINSTTDDGLMGDMSKVDDTQSDSDDDDDIVWSNEIPPVVKYGFDDQQLLDGLLINLYDKMESVTKHIKLVTERDILLKQDSKTSKKTRRKRKATSLGPPPTPQPPSQ